jgi:hypothetical protein
MNSSTHPYEQEEVMAYLDGELSADRASGVAAHLRECAECAELADQMRGVSIHLANWSVEPTPASLASGLEASCIAKSGTAQRDCCVAGREVRAFTGTLDIGRGWYCRCRHIVARRRASESSKNTESARGDRPEYARRIQTIDGTSHSGS